MSMDLEAKLTLDYTDLDDMQAEIEQRTAKIDASAEVDVDTGRAEANLEKAKSKAEDLSDSLERPKKVDVDTSSAERKLSSMTDAWRDRWTKAIDEVSTNLSKMQTGDVAKDAWMGGLMAPKTGAMLGAGMAIGGVAIAGSAMAGTMEAAKTRALMERSTTQIFGSAADAYETEAQRLADSTGYMTTALQQAQLTLQKSRVATGLADTGGGAISPLVGRVADMAATSGLPQFADDVDAVARAVASGLQGTSTALLDFGIRLDDAYVLSLGVNQAFKAMGEAITPAQMAQARYNAIMAQTASINGKASETQDDASRSLQKFHQSMESAKASIGEVLLPIANFVADFIANIPKPVLIAGLATGIGVGLVSAIGGAIIGVSALRRAIQDLSHTATTSAIETAAASTATTKATGKVSGGLTSLATKATTAAAMLGASIPIIGGTYNWAKGSLDEPRQQESLHDIYRKVVARATLAKEGERVFGLTDAADRAGAYAQYGDASYGGLSKAQVDAAFDAAEAAAIMNLQATGHISADMAQQLATKLQQNIEERNRIDAFGTNPAVAAQQTLNLIIYDRSDGGLDIQTNSNYAEPNY